MWTRGLRTRSSLSCTLSATGDPSDEKAVGSRFVSVLPLAAWRSSPRSIVVVLARRADADLAEQLAARRLVGDQLAEQLRQRHVAPADDLLQAVRQHRVRLG